MTIEQILNGTNSVPVDELKNRFLAKSIRSGITSRVEGAKQCFMENIERAVMRIADNSIISYYGPSYVGEQERQQLTLSDEDKVELIKGLKEIAFKQLSAYKNSIDYVFGNEKTEVSEKPAQSEPEKKVEVEIEAPAVQAVKQMFGY